MVLLPVISAEKEIGLVHCFPFALILLGKARINLFSLPKQDLSLQLYLVAILKVLLWLQNRGESNEKLLHYLSQAVVAIHI